MALIKGLKIEKGRFQLDIPALEILDSGITALLGPSGSGKSTIFRIIMGLDPCPCFSWILGGIDIGQLPVVQRQLGVVFQSYDLFPHMTAKENILFAADVREIPEQRATEQLAKLVERLQISEILETRASNLSGGESQRVALARALIGAPRAILLDEPFSALDEGLRTQARLLVKEVLKEYQVPVILITHDERDVADLASKSYRLRSGHLE